MIIKKFKNKYKHSSRNKQRIINVFLVFLLLAVIGIGYRIYSEILLRAHTQQQSVLSVATLTPAQGPLVEKILLPGDVQAWHEASIYARTNGYIKAWYTDIGAHVNKGDVLALIEAPEIDAQLLQAKADLKAAQADYELAITTNIRWKILLKTESVSKQDADEKDSAEKATRARVEAAKANVEYLNELVKFQQIVAPFDGIITLRNIDIGSLIDNGGSSVETALFNIVQADLLRVYASVPQKYTSRLSPDMAVKLYFNEYPDKLFDATLLYTAQGIDNNTRTLLAEFLVDNADNQLLPGSYTQFQLLLPSPDHMVRLPVNTLLFRAQGLQVGTVNPDSTVTLKSIVIGRDFGDELEIIKGISSDDQVIINPADSLADGQKVKVVKHSDYQSKP